MSELKPCPFCGGSVVIASGGDDWNRFLFITRGCDPDSCKCRVFMESRHCIPDKFDEMRETLKKELAEAWNRRAE